MQELNFIQSVQERDIDLMLLEECHTSMAFCNWLVSRVYEFPHAVEFVGAWHSVIHNQYGESDLVVIFKANDGSHQAILIENKIDATPQQQQGLRYRYRGEHGIEQGYWVDFRTCLLAPQKYLASNNEPMIKPSPMRNSWRTLSPKGHGTGHGLWPRASASKDADTSPALAPKSQSLPGVILSLRKDITRS